ncbi:MAG: ThuA domain-containing protein [Reichenbachiella sp.]
MKKLTLILKTIPLLLFIVGLINCSVATTETAGGAGGTEVPNGIAGIIEDESGEPVAGAIITLRSDEYANNTIATKTASHTPLVDTTDEQGAFYFIVSDTGTFVIEAYSNDSTATRFSFSKTDTAQIDLGTQTTTATGGLSGSILFDDTLSSSLLIQLLGSPHTFIVEPGATLFSMNNIPTGIYAISVTGLTPYRTPKTTNAITVYSDSINSGIMLNATSIVIPLDTTNLDTTDTLPTDTVLIDTTQTYGSFSGTITGTEHSSDTIFVQIVETNQITTAGLYGVFEFPQLLPGTYTVRAWSSSPHRDTTTALSFDITPGDRSSGHILTLPIKVLIIDGVNFHDWKTISTNTQTILESSQLFKVSRSTSPGAQDPIEDWNRWSPTFADYGVVIINYDSPDIWYNHSHTWPNHVKTLFENYLRNGGNAVVLHSGRNSNGGWKEYDDLLGLGFFINGEYPSYSINQDYTITIETVGEGHHTFSTEGEMLVEQLASSHPINKNLPTKWLHDFDTMDGGFTGPAKNITILNTVWNDSTQTRIPFDWVVDYNSSRIYNTNYGHIIENAHDGNGSMNCIGLQTMLIRGVEWAATGSVLYAKPDNFPTETETSTQQ